MTDRDALDQHLRATFAFRGLDPSVRVDPMFVAARGAGRPVSRTCRSACAG
ncbi:MAG: hypothetical protein ACSLFM_13055 [Tepidiformaceae bacterium]